MSSMIPTKHKPMLITATSFVRKAFKIWIVVTLLFCLSSIFTLGFCDSGENSASIAKFQNDELPASFGSDLNDSEIRFDEQAECHILYFFGTECPISRLYTDRLKTLYSSMSDRRVCLIAIDSNLQDTAAELAVYGEVNSLPFPIVKDSSQELARRFSIQRIPSVVLLDHHGTVRYRGRIDDQYSPGIKRTAPKRRDLQIAVDELLEGKSISVTQSPAAGCLLTFEPLKEKVSATTFCKSIVPILYQHCYECHRASEIGPFDVSSYSDVRGWSEMMLEVIQQKRMPPWNAVSETLAFKNERHLPDNVLTTLRQWIDDGMPYGDEADLPARPKFTDGWRLPREPDLVIEMRDRPFVIPAEGTVEYQYFVVDPKITEDRWVSAAQVIPGNAQVVHHAIAFVRPPDGDEFNGIGWLTAYVPGQFATTFPDGYARRIPAGSKFVFQMHYTPNGKLQSDVTKVGINFIEPSLVTHEVFTLVGIDQQFEIPPNAEHFAVKGSLEKLPQGGELLSLAPHMHLRGKSFALTAKRGLMTEHLLTVPRYDFNWQHTYELATPLKLSNVDTLDFEVVFDNSQQNPFNPNPDEYVMWGDQTWEEMAVAFFQVARPRVPLPTGEIASKTDVESSTVVSDPTAEDVEFSDNFLSRFDKNHDSIVSFDETPRIVQDYTFLLIDANRDRRINREELIAAAKARRDR